MEVKELKDPPRIKEVGVKIEEEITKEEGEEEITTTIGTRITVTIAVSKAKAKIIKMYIIKIKEKVVETGGKKSSRRNPKLTWRVLTKGN